MLKIVGKVIIIKRNNFCHKKVRKLHMTHKGTQDIHTKRLLLRKFSVDDATAMFKNWANDQRITKYLTWTPHQSVDETKSLLQLWCAEYDKENYYNWAIELDGEPIGNVSVVRFNDKSEWAELGYCMKYDLWNKGIMTEAVGAVINYLFAEINVHRVEIDYDSQNPASGKVAQKCGLVLEGTRRECYKSSNGKFSDICFCGITKSDWEKRRS